MASNAHASETDLKAAAEREAYRQRLDTFLASREAGGSLTRDSLGAGIRLRTVVGAAAAVADFADEALSIVKDEYRPSLHCKEGCSYCCRKPGVLITVPELLRILSVIRSSFADEAQAALMDRARQYAAQIEGRSFNDATDESVPCPLLVEGRCSVYAVRPLVCRGYNSTNVNSCRKAHQDASQRVPMFSVLKDVTDGATVGAVQQLQAAGLNDAMVDLGSALNLALAAGDEPSAAILAGDVDLSRTQNTMWATELWTRVQATARDVGLSP